MKGLTRRQKEVLDFIDASVRSKGYPPSVREIAAQFHLVSASGVHKHIKALVKKKYLSKQDFTSRSLRVLRRQPGQPALAAEGSVLLPVMGNVSSGQPLEPSPIGGQSMSVPLVMVGQRDSGSYILRLKGDAMIEEGLCDGDYLIVEPRESVQDGEMAVVRLPNGETTIKRVFREGGEARLQSGNTRFTPTRVIAADLHIQGVVLTVWRRYQ